MNRPILITGASTGIGYDAARHLLGRGYHVYGSVRRPADAERLQEELGEQFVPLLFDVTDEPAIAAAAEQVSTELGDGGLAGLVNNAGIAVPGPLMHLPLEDLRRQFEVNIIGLLAVTQAFLPLLGARQDAPHPPGRIVNISSVSGRITYPFLGPYSASKHALEAISDALRRELILYGIDVIVIQPGSVQTPIWDKAAEIDLAPLADTDYAPILAGYRKVMLRQGREGIPVERVSQVIAEALESPRPKTRYVLARNFLTGWLIPRYLPDRWFDRMVAKRLRPKRRK